MEERRDPNHQFCLEDAYNRVYHLMVEIEKDRDWWRKQAIAEGVILLSWLVFMIVEAW